MSENNSSNSASEVWNLPISREEYEEIMMWESVMEIEETMQLLYEEEMAQLEEAKRMQRVARHYADDRDYDQYYAENPDYWY